MKKHAEIVVDTSVVIAVIVNEPVKKKLIAATSGKDLVAPGSLNWEIGNAFSAMFKRRSIPIGKTLKMIETYKKLPIRLVDVDLKESLQFANDLKIYAYDAYFLTCAKYCRLPLLTLDETLLASARKIGIDVVEV